MSHYSIKELETLTGIKAHTIRIWEQRYGILKPARTVTNIRTYTDEELKNLLNISLLNHNGIKISKLAKMQKEEIKQRVLSVFETNPTYFNLSEALTTAMIDFDEEKFEKLLESNIQKLGFETAFINVIFPFLHRLGLLWQTDVIKIAQEHFVSNLVRRKIIVAIDSIRMQCSKESTRMMLFLPEGELHELSLLFMNYLVRSRGHHVLYLGANIPMEDIITCQHDYKPDYMFIVITTYPAIEDTLTYINDISAISGKAQLIITGGRAIALREKLPSNVRLLNTIEDAVIFVDNL